MVSTLKRANGVRISPNYASQLTAALGSTVAVGDAVTRDAVGSYVRGADDAAFHGVCLSKEKDGLGTVGQGGRVMVKLTASAAAVGTTVALVVNGSGVCKPGSGTAWILEAEETIDSVIYGVFTKA